MKRGSRAYLERSHNQRDPGNLCILPRHYPRSIRTSVQWPICFQTAPGTRAIDRWRGPTHQARRIPMTTETRQVPSYLHRGIGFPQHWKLYAFKESVGSKNYCFRAIVLDLQQVLRIMILSRAGHTPCSSMWVFVSPAGKEMWYSTKGSQLTKSWLLQCRNGAASSKASASSAKKKRCTKIARHFFKNIRDHRSLYKPRPNDEA